MKNSAFAFISLLSILFFSCKESKDETITPTKQAPERHEPKKISYTLENSKSWLQNNGSDNSKLAIVLLANRVDQKNLSKMDSILVPTDLTGDLVFYQPFPLEVESLKDVDKILFFSYATQTFAAYENGVLSYVGPTSMGRKSDQTPTGLFFTNWKAEKTISTFNDEWDLKWNFNIENKLGVGFHEYELPGVPASHSCLRLLEKDAKFLYDWADQWVLSNPETVKLKGTPVIVFGTYAFGESKPWLELVKDPKALTLSESEIERQAASHLKTILAEQKKTDR